MPLPTLLKKGALVASTMGISKKKADSMTPMEYILNLVKNSLEELNPNKKVTMSDKVFIIRSKTGSGKSTAMPVELYRLFNPSVHNLKDDKELVTSLRGTYRGKNIAVTQPRVLTTIDIPTELANHEENPWSKDMLLGETIGYSTGTKKIMCQNCILYMSLDTLLVQLRTMTDEEIRSLYRIIILDEVHERNVTLDIVIMLLKSFMIRSLGYIDCPIIIFTSATFDIVKYSEYFGTNTLVDVEGLTYPITEVYTKQDVPNYLNEIADIIERIHLKGENEKPQGQHDILIFIPSVGDYKAIKRQLAPLLKRCIEEGNPFMYVLADSGTVGSTIVFRDLKLSYDELKIDETGEYNKNGEYLATRRIFIGTTVAETGLTIPTLGFVLDLGLVNQVESFHPYGIGGLIKKPVNKSRVRQRKGRVGRKFPGVAYFLYTEDTFKLMAEIQLPDVFLQNIRKDIITILEEQEGKCFDITKVDMLDTPPVDAIKDAITNALITGIVERDDEGCYTLTEIGKLIKGVQYITPEQLRIFRSAYLYDVSIQDICTILAMSSEWRRPFSGKYSPDDILAISLPKYLNKEKFYLITLDQFIEELYFFNAFTKKVQTDGANVNKWCEKVGLKFDEMLAVIKTRASLMNDLAIMGFNPKYGEEFAMSICPEQEYFSRVCAIKKCLYDGFILNMVTFDRDTLKYKNRFGLGVSNPRGIPYDIRKYCNTVITNRIKIDSAEQETYKKVLSVDRWSVLDGFIGVDYEYLLPNV